MSEIIESLAQPALTSGPTKRIPDSMELRGLAILLVVLSHYVQDGPVGPELSWRYFENPLIRRGHHYLY